MGGAAREQHQQHDGHQEKQRHIPILRHGLKKYRGEIAIVLKLREERASGTAVGEADIDHVDAIDRDAERVGHPIEPLRHPQIMAIVAHAERQGQQHEQQIDGVEVQQCRKVETHAAAEHLPEVSGRHGRVHIGVDTIKEVAGHGIDGQYQKQVCGGYCP